jgi:hypothetical protein
MNASLMIVTLTMASLVSQKSATQFAQPARAAPKFSLTIKTAQGTVKVGSDVVVEAEMKNTSVEDIFYSALTGRGQDPGRSGFAWEILNVEGKPVPLTEYGLKINHLESPQDEVGPGGYIPSAGKTVYGLLGPGKAIVENRTLSKEYDLSKPGKYTVQASRFDGKTDVKSNTLTLTVMP